MAVAHTGTDVSATEGSNRLDFDSFVVASGELIVAFVHLDGNRVVDNVRWGSSTNFTQLGPTFNTGYGSVDIWFLDGVSGTEQVSIFYDTMGKNAGGLALFTGHDAADPLPSADYVGEPNDGQGSPQIITGTNIGADDMIVDVLRFDVQGETLTEGANQTEIMNINASGNINVASWQPGGEADDDMSWSWVSGTSDLAHAVARIKAAISSDVAATSALAFGQTADLTAIGVLADTSAITFGQTANLTAIGVLSATSLLAFGQTADLLAIGVLDATSALVFGQTADLLAIGEIDATSAIVFGQTSDITAIGVVSATSVLAFGETADLGGLLDELTATSGLAFGQTADLLGPAFVTATSAIAFGETADITAIGIISATSAIVFGETADISAIGVLDATSALVFGETAGVSAIGVMGATSAIVLGDTADLLAIGVISATSAIIFGETADLEGPISALFPYQVFKKKRDSMSALLRL